MKSRLKSLSIMTAILCVLASAISASAAESGTGPFTIQASLLTPERITLGEPVLIRYKLTNASPQNVITQQGTYGTDWYTLTLRDAKGIPVSSAPTPQFTHISGSYSSKGGFFRGGESDTDYILVTKRLVIQHPGQYTLTFHARLPYVTDDTLTEGTSESLATSSGLIQTQDITFPTLVAAPNAGQLRAAAEKLQKSATDPINGLFGRANMDALFSMPEEQVSAIWRDLALRPSINNDLVASELETLHSKTGVDILAEMLDVPDLQCTPVSDRLNRVYNTADPALREHIKDIARKHGFEMPDIAGVPAVLKDPEPDSGGTIF